MQAEINSNKDTALKAMGETDRGFLGTSTGVRREFGRFDTKSFRYKSIRHKLKSFRDIIEVNSIHVESQFDSTQPLS